MNIVRLNAIHHCSNTLRPKIMQAVTPMWCTNTHLLLLLSAPPTPFRALKLSSVMVSHRKCRFALNSSRVYQLKSPMSISGRGIHRLPPRIGIQVRRSLVARTHYLESHETRGIKSCILWGMSQISCFSLSVYLYIYKYM